MRKLGIFFVLLYLRLLAKSALALHKPYVIGIAGSVGKSSTKNALMAILKDSYSCEAVGNSETGIPLGILGIVPTSYSVSAWISMLLRAPIGIMHLKGIKYLVAEMGIDEPVPPKNMTYLLSILKPNIAVSLNVAIGDATPPHAMQFESILTSGQNFDRHEALLN